MNKINRIPLIILLLSTLKVTAQYDPRSDDEIIITIDGDDSLYINNNKNNDTKPLYTEEYSGNGIILKYRMIGQTYLFYAYQNNQKIGHANLVLKNEHEMILAWIQVFDRQKGYAEKIISALKAIQPKKFPHITKVTGIAKQETFGFYKKIGAQISEQPISHLDSTISAYHQITYDLKRTKSLTN